MTVKAIKTIRLDPKWVDKIENSAERQGKSFSEVVRQRIKFGLSIPEYRRVEDLAKRQDISETEVIEQGIKYTSVLLDPNVSFSDAINTTGEVSEDKNIPFSEAVKPMPKILESVQESNDSRTPQERQD